MWRFMILCGLLVPASAFAQPTPAWALEPSSVDAIHQTWSGRDLGDGKTSNSNGLDTVTVTPQGGSVSPSNSSSLDGQNAVGTIYGSPKTPPIPLLLPPPRPAGRACDPYCADPKR
ncbi:MAG: hypothetical protein HXY51_12110 [Nitrospirae bacterium]|nr:hypothetical protein [Nitrospirota bacterium]